MKSKNKIGRRIVAIVLSAALFGGVSGVVFNSITRDRFQQNKNSINDLYDIVEPQHDAAIQDNEAVDLVSTQVEQPVVLPTTSVADDGIVRSQSLDVSDIASSVMPAIVSVTIKGVQEIPNFFGTRQQYEIEGCGSGIIVGENTTELLIVTNNHVVEDAETVSVSFIDGNTYDAKVKGTDVDNDLAIITVRKRDLTDDTKNQIKIAKLGDSDALKVGEQVVAIGNALGYGQSVTTGIVSAKNCMNSTNATPLIQTDAAINPGNSGGALINMDGEVIGINSSKYASTDVEGMGFAIPISSVETIIDDLMNQKQRDKVPEEKRGYLGIGCSTITADYSYMYNIPQGVLITEVQKHSGAARAGLKENDVITKLDGHTVKTTDALIDLLSYYEVGTKVTITYQTIEDDVYVEKEIEVTLGEKSTS